MKRLKLIFGLSAFLLAGGVFHYVLPQHDIVRITSTEIIRTDFSWYNGLFYAQADSGNATQPNRDLRLINTERKKAFLFGFIPREATGIMVYRNEDTGWIWPPYFKFDSSDLQAQAAAGINPNTEQWVVIAHYGWRNRLLSIYPNAVAIRPVSGPDATVIPWFNIFFFVFLSAAILFVRSAWRRFRERRLNPAIDGAAATWDEVEDRAGDARARARGLWERLLSRLGWS